MARRKSQAEQTMLKITHEFEDSLRDEYPEQLTMIPSWAGSDLYMDIKLPGGWKRVIRVIEDDMEIAGIRELA